MPALDQKKQKEFRALDKYCEDGIRFTEEMPANWIARRLCRQVHCRLIL